jgi:hypothetical protein
MAVSRLVCTPQTMNHSASNVGSQPCQLGRGAGGHSLEKDNADDSITLRQFIIAQPQ